MSARDLADTHHASLATRICVPSLVVIPQAALTNREHLLFQRRIQICQGIYLTSRGLREREASRRKIKPEGEREKKECRFNFNSKKGIECIIDVSALSLKNSRIAYAINLPRKGLTYTCEI